ncbi:MAG: sialidase family protein [Acidimicrobiales bacterium]
MVGMTKGAQRFLMVLAIGLVAAGCSSPSTSLEVGRPVVVTDERVRLSRTYEAPSLLVDNQDPDSVYLAAVDLQSGENRFYVSTNQGRTWKQSAGPKLEPFTDGGLGAGNPKNVRTELAQDAKGTIFYLYHAHDRAAGGARSVLLGRSSDKGITWKTTAVVAAPPGTEEATELNWQAHVAIDPGNEQRVYVAWRRAFQIPAGTPARPVRPFLAVSNDGGATFGPATLLMDKATGFEGPRLAVQGDKLFAFYRLNAPAAGPNVPEPRFTTIVASVSTDQGGTWTDAEVAGARDASEPVNLYDPERRMHYLVWHDNRNQDLDIFFSMSSDGARWSEPRQLNDDPKGNRIGQFYPKISLVPGGRIDVAWYDFRDDSFPAPTVAPTATAPFLGLTSNVGKFDAVYLTSSEDGGGTWSKNIRMSDVPNDRTLGTAGPQFFVQVPLAVASGEDWAVVAWSDTRHANTDNSTQDIATNVVDLAASEPGGYRASDVGWAVAAGLVLGAGLAMVFAFARMRSVNRPAGTPASGRPPKEPASSSG